MSLSRCCAVPLEPRYEQEPFTMNTPIGSTLQSWLTAWVCPTCGLMYDPKVLGIEDPREVNRREAEAAKQEWQRERYRKMFEGATFDALRGDD